MAATNSPSNLTLAALTAAAMGLPGLQVSAATPVTQAEGGTEFGFYSESSHRMQVEMFHTGGLIPLNDRIELSFSLDRDTYSGASPAYSLPETMINQPATKKSVNGKAYADVISAASAVSAATLAGGESTLQQSSNFLQASNAVATQLDTLFEGLLGIADPANLPADIAASISQEAKLAGFTAALANYTPPNTKPVQRFQTQPLETRSQPVLGLKYYFDDTTVGISGGLSDEPDFLSNFGGINFSHEFNNKTTTLTGGYSITRNAIFRNQSHSHSPSGIDLEHVHPADCTVSPCTDYSQLKANSLFQGINFGFSQILGKNTLFNFNGEYTNQGGFLNNAYKTVYVRGILTPQDYVNLSNAGPTDNFNSIVKSPLEIVGPELFRENRPGWRNIGSLNAGLNQHIPAIDASVHFNYRYYLDDWNVSAHTFDIKWYQSLPFNITVTPNVRYYSQSQAFYYAPYYLAPRADNFYSSDYRLSAFGALSAGISFERKFGKAVKLDAGIDYYKHAGNYKLGGGGSGDYADYSYYMVHAGVNMNFSAPGSLLSGEESIIGTLFGEGDQHAQHNQHHHTHFGSLPPAGVMFGHMMNQADDAMVGYLYMNSTQAGTMLHGSHAVSDQQIVANGCPSYSPAAPLNGGCLTKSANMSMGMHMLDIMYAPTDWLNLMVMPQLMDMSMNMSTDLRQANYDPNGTYTELHASTDKQSFYSQMHHSVFDLGDTILMPLFKVFENDNHHVHVGAGVSAPTGSVAEVHNILTSVQIAGNAYDANVKVLQDYGMQSGSGTWDFKPNLTYNGQFEDIFWGGQFNATHRMQSKNSSGYALGDIYQGSVWAGYKLFNWLSGTVRGIYTQQDKMKGDLYQLNVPALVAGQTSQYAHMLVSPTDYPQNSGGHYWDVGLGMRVSLPSGPFAGHTLSIEWLQPVKDYVNGYQLERTAGFAANWSYMF